jgi:predicted N-acetyltransferase YhbS
MVTIRHELEKDAAPREALLDRAFGKSRFRKTSQRLRDGRLAAEGLAFTALSKLGRVIGTIRLWEVIAGTAGSALLLGPLAVDARHQKKGIGQALMERALNEARVRGARAVLLMGDEPYYGRFGFSTAMTAGLALPGPVDRSRFLGVELVPGALAGAQGIVTASGQMADAVTQAA